MAVFYRLAKNNNQKSTQFGKWYAKAVSTCVIGTEEIAGIIQENCSMKKSDVKAVLDELVSVMNQALKDSKRVKLDGFGSFKMGLVTTPADSAAEFSVTKNVAKVRVNFRPEVKKVAGKISSQTFVSGTYVAELPKNDVNKTEGEDDEA